MVFFALAEWVQTMHCDNAGEILTGSRSKQEHEQSYSTWHASFAALASSLVRPDTSGSICRRGFETSVDARCTIGVDLDHPAMLILFLVHQLPCTAMPF